MVEHIAAGIRHHTDIAVVGLSGGADSSLVATLCADAVGARNVYGVSMPYNDFDTATFNAASTRLAGKLGIRHLLRPVREIADAISRQVSVNVGSQPTALNAGNSRSRARMCVLYGIAHDLASGCAGKRIRVVGTGNLSEDFIGYDTKGGDALADFFPIGELFKSEVYQLLEHFRDRLTIDEADINRTPSAGLQEGQTDEGDLGYTYYRMEDPVRFCLANGDSMPDTFPDEVTRFVWNRHHQNAHKHQAPPVLKLRHLCD